LRNAHAGLGLDRPHQFLLGHGPVQAAQRPFDFAEVVDFVGQLHSFPGYESIAIRDKHIAYCNIVKSASE
jgi:hypothetical protein